MFPSQSERTFSEEEEQKLQAALSLEKKALSLVLETAAFILEQVRAGHPTILYYNIVSAKEVMFALVSVYLSVGLCKK